MEGVKKLFDEIFGTRGKNLPQIWHWSNEVESYYLIKILKKIKPKFILDAGCGVGLKLERIRNYNVIGFDYSFNACKICKNDGFKVIQASIHQIPFKDNTFDFIYAFQVIQHLPNWDYIKMSFKEISRILKENGYFFTINYRLGGRLKERYMPINENNNILHRWAFDVNDYINLAKENNLKLVRFGTILNIKPKGIGRLPILKNFYKFIDYQIFNLNYQKGLYLIGLFKK
ncbi:MAG: class I SAM-dependent methyltransferase [candidate division WOR-3 bacterium]|jgi:SAM-dependent methyltransferase